MDNTAFTFTTFSGSTPMLSNFYEDKRYTISNFTEEQKMQSCNQFNVVYPNFIEFRTTYWAQDLPLNINLDINFDDMERRKFLFDLNAEIKNRI